MELKSRKPLCIRWNPFASFPPFLCLSFDSCWFCLYQSWEAGHRSLRMCIIRTNWLNPVRWICSHINLPCHPCTAPSLKCIQCRKSSHWNNWKAGSAAEIAGKQQHKKKKTVIPNSLNKPGGKQGKGNAGRVTVDRVKATDEWLQEAFMSDISHHTSHSDKKCHSRDKRTQVVRGLKQPA